jgi:transposase
MRWTNKKLAKFFEVSEVTMRRWIDKLQLARFVVDGRNKMSPFYNKDRNSLIYEDYWTHQKSLSDIGKIYGMSRQRVHQIVKRAEKPRLKGLL